MSVPFKHQINFHFSDFGALKYYLISERIVQWVNQCFDLTTNRYFFCGQVRTNVTEWPEHSSAGYLPSGDFPIEVYIVPFVPGWPLGNCLFGPNGSGAVVAHSRVDMSTILRAPCVRNLELFNTVLHEIGHCFGMAVGEYYQSKVVVDLTGVAPELKVSLFKLDDYWSHKPDWTRDPMLNPQAASPKFCRLSSVVAEHGLWRAAGPPAPDLEQVRIKSKFPKAQVEVYRMGQEWDQIYSGQTDQAGKFSFPWGCDCSNAVSNQQMRKIIFDGVAARGVSIFDVQEAWLCSPSQNWKLNEQPPQVDYSVEL